MERVLVCRARDGKIFELEAKCLAYEAELDFDDWYESNAVPGNQLGSRVLPFEIKDWLRTNKEVVNRFLTLSPLNGR